MKGYVHIVLIIILVIIVVILLVLARHAGLWGTPTPKAIPTPL
jgi:uncharacterized protein YpmB